MFQIRIRNILIQIQIYGPVSLGYRSRPDPVLFFMVFPAFKSVFKDERLFILEVKIL
jgi:hypothetical protein